MEVLCFEFPRFQFNSHKTVQRAIEKQQVNVLVFAERVKMILVPDKSEVFAKCEDKVLHIVDDCIFDNPFIQILSVTDAKLFHVNEIQQVFIFEDADCPKRLICRRKRPNEIVRKIPLMMIVVGGYALL